MGCCSAKTTHNKKTLMRYVESSGLCSFTCFEIKRLAKEISADFIDKNAFEALALEWNIQIPFEVFSARNKISKLDLQIVLLLFSNDANDVKLKFFQELVQDDKRLIMKFLEFRYQLINDKIPQELCRLNCLEEHEAKEWINSSRIAAGEELIEFFNKIWEDYKSAYTSNLLYIN